ncbi:DASH complex subunit Ask1-domain-containing protein [Hypoxylon sp. NC1633]|nr:DASH complex subunit Ask1-domain-containing protein [Hypoxylon sp. NC1633]
MSRPGPSSGRSLTLTEELERLEQSITLTLQEIDHNFSKAHRIVTTSILPLVEQYGEESKAVWEASKFWKQFFEASANVSLSGYEELAGEDEETTTAEETTLDETTSDYDNTTETDTAAEQSGYHDLHHEQRAMPNESILDDAEMTGSTPRPPSTRSLHVKPQMAHFESPYEKLRRERRGEDASFNDDERLADEDADDDDDDETTEFPPRPTRIKFPNMSMTPRSSSLLEEPAHQDTSRKNKDPLLHRVLDKNYRLQATPHKTNEPPLRLRGRSPEKIGESDEDRTRRAMWQDSPMSSPEIAVPKLRSDLYMSPAKLRSARTAFAGDAPRTPGVSVHTPATAKKTRDVFAEAKGKGLSQRDPDEITWESDDDEEFGAISPPKTIQFALPQSRLLQTPAREASKRIVDDILITAGAGPDDSSEYSPTMVKMNHDILDDTF